MRLELDNTMMMVIDVQERLFPHIQHNDKLLSRLQILIKGLQALAVDIMLNEQYKKGLGATLAPIAQLLTTTPTFEKVTFSAIDDDPSKQHITGKAKKNIILAGVESHVCVMQTALDLLAQDYLPVIVVDAVGSRHELDHQTALLRLRDSGALLATTESILFELCRSSKNPSFKTISGLVK